MSLKRVITGLFFTCFVALINANGQDTFSISVKDGSRDSIDFYLAQSEILIDSLPEKSLLLAERAKVLSGILKNKERFAHANHLAGEANIKLNQYYQAEKMLQQALAFYEKGNNTRAKAEINFSLGVTRYHLNNFSKALDDYDIASELYNELEDDQSYANTMQCMGLAYSQLNELEEAENYYYKSLAINKAINNNKNIAELYQNLGIICYNRSNDSLALNYYSMSTMFYKKEHNLKGIGVNYSNIGLVYLRSGDYSNALDNFTLAHTYFIKAKYEIGQIWALNNAGAALASLNELDNAALKFNESLKIARRVGSIEGVLTNLTDISKYYEQTGKLKESLVYQKRYNTLKDSIQRLEASKRISELESLYLMESSKREMVEADIYSKASSTKYYAIVSLLIVLVIAVLVVLTLFMQKQRAERKLVQNQEQLKSLIHERAEEIQHHIQERKSAEESDKLKSAFLANMSHELRTPMNAIIAFSNFLRDPDVTTKQKSEYLDHIGNAGDTLLCLIDDIIDIAKIESQQLKLFIQPTNINLLLIEIYKVYTELRIKNKEKKNVAFNLNIDNSYNYIINTDSKRLKQVLSNLLDNAFKYTDSGRIEIGFSATDSSVLFHVSDTGVGIPKDKHEVIFDRFSQLRYANDTRTTSGTGLGLAISKNLIKLLGGDMHVDSAVGMGSKFLIRLPVDSIKRQVNSTVGLKKKKAPIPIQSQYDWNELTILVAEDEDLNYKVLDTCLKKTKAHIIRARDGVSAVDICKTQKVDLVLMDIQMPGMNGYEATKEIKRLNNRTPVIAQTSFAMVGEKEKCLQAGCDDFITKPLDIKMLLQKIEDHVFSYVRQV